MATPRPGMIAAAMDRIDPPFLWTPIIRSDAMNRKLGLELLFKDETANPIRSFKGRGACTFADGLNGSNSIVCASAGNFGQGLAWAARLHDLKLTVFTSENAVKSKIEAIRRLGATVILAGLDFDAAKINAAEWAEAHCATFVEDGAHPEISEGAGTIALELTAEVATFDAIVCPLGNGALVAGVGAWMRQATPDVEIVAVCAAGAPAMALSFWSGELAETAEVKTIADGIAVRKPVPAAVDALPQLIDDVVLVGDRHIVEAMRLVKEELGLTIEPAAAAGLAAIIAAPKRWAGRSVALPLCGGNI